MHDTGDMIDIGPAPTPTPPQWWVPGLDPDYFVDDGVPITAWTRLFGSDDVWITVYDRIVGGRVMRSKPSVYVSDALAAPSGGLTIERARELAQTLLEAIETAEGDAARVRVDPFGPDRWDDMQSSAPAETERYEFLVCRRDGERVVVCSRHADGVAGWGALDRERKAMRRAGIDTSGDDAPWLERVAPGGQPGEGVRL